MCEIEKGAFHADIDIGEMFLNFMLHPLLCPYCGVDVSHVQSSDETDAEWEAKRRNKWERWARDCMGLADSPYRAIQVILWAKEIALGSKSDPANPFQWDRVELNLPRRNYNPTKPWVAKIRGDGKNGWELGSLHPYATDWEYRMLQKNNQRHLRCLARGREQSLIAWQGWTPCLPRRSGTRQKST